VPAVGIFLATTCIFLSACRPPPATPAVPISAAAPAPTGAPADWEQQWSRLIEGARQEGSVIVAGPPTPATRTAVAAAFKTRFGVDVDYFAPGSTSTLMTRLVSERAAGQYTVDAILGGAAGLYPYVAEGMFDPLPPVLIHPDATDPGKWVTGGIWYMDPDQQYVARLARYRTLEVAVNTQYVNPGEFTSWRELLSPRHRGKISTSDPGLPGTGSNTAAYLVRVLGEDWVRTFYRDQQPGISRDSRQLSDWLARGTYPITLGLGPREIEPLRDDGFPITVVLSDSTEIPPAVAAGNGMVVLMNRAPHPSAARLFVNWIVTREGQEVWARTQETVSLRNDLDNSWVPDYVIPKPGRDYFDTASWEWTFDARNPDEMERLKRLTGR
jgi:iron(III) transport system substrate-binding protein